MTSRLRITAWSATSPLLRRRLGRALLSEASPVEHATAVMEYREVGSGVDRVKTPAQCVYISRGIAEQKMAERAKRRTMRTSSLAIRSA